MRIASIFFLITAVSLATATPYKHPLIATACHVQPNVTWPAAGYDCFKAFALKHGWADLDTELSHSEKVIKINRAASALMHETERLCGAGCRPFYATMGKQCLALAQSRKFAGYGSFMGEETTLDEAEETALVGCREHVGEPGSECVIVTSACPRIPSAP